jgi:type II secretory ATPase GspE/PulE/Tfp pilus assembly ATPase PilB-like protein
MIEPIAANANDEIVPIVSRYIDFEDDFEGSSLLSAYVAAFEDGRCIIARDQANNADVRKLLAVLEERLNVRLKRSYGTLDEIADYRKKGLAGRRGEADGGMQSRILDLIEDAHKVGASDVHIEVGTEIATVQFRVDGRLIKTNQWKSDYGLQFLGAAYAMADIANQSYSTARFLGARLAPRSGRDRWTFPEGLEAVRMQLNPIAFGSSYGVFRLLKVTDATEKPHQLGYEPEQLAILLAFSRKNKGLGIISGPTGSGKSTTMCALLLYARETDAKNGNIRALFTVEDPPERRLPGAQQLVVPNTNSDEDRARAFADAIRAAMRSDPDQIMIGEIRDKTSANLAISASMTGHHVWSTLHCMSAHAIPMRLIDLDVDRSIIFGSDELYVAAAQVLVPLLCIDCRVSSADAIQNKLIDSVEYKELTKAFGPDFYIVGQGCAKCGGSGVRGRTVAAEVIRTDAAYLEVLSTQGIIAARNFCRERGEPSIADVAARKVRRGEVSAIDAARVVDLDDLCRQQHHEHEGAAA